MKKLDFLLILVVVILLGYSYFANYQYDVVIGAYIDNAYEVNTPELMMKNIDYALQGMKDSGLRDEDYGALIFKKPSNKMSFQYEYLDNFKERANAVIIWRENIYRANSTQSETLGDVYETKMDNLREFLYEGGKSDWISKDTWMIKHHIIVYLWDTLFGNFFMLIVLGCLLYFFRWGGLR